MHKKQSEIYALICHCFLLHPDSLCSSCTLFFCILFCPGLYCIYPPGVCVCSLYPQWGQFFRSSCSIWEAHSCLHSPHLKILFSSIVTLPPSICSARLLTSASATFFRAQRRILWNVGCEIPIACAASSCSIPRRSFSLIASYSSRDSVVFPQHVLFPPVGFRLMAAGFWHILLHLLGRAFFSGYEYIFIWIYKWKLIILHGIKEVIIPDSNP